MSKQPGRTVLVDATNISAATHYLPLFNGSGVYGYGALLGTNETLALQMACSGGVTVTVEATFGEPAMGEAAPAWEDITAKAVRLSTGAVGAASFVDQSCTIWFPALPIYRWRVKVVTSDATNAVRVIAVTMPSSIAPAVLAALPLPAGAATEAKQDTGNTSLSNIDGHVHSIDGKLPAQGQALMAASVPVVVASNQSAVAISASALPLPTGAATSAAQTDGSQKSIVRGAAKGVTTAADCTSYTVDADHQAIEVHLATLIAGEHTDHLDVADYSHDQIHRGKHFTVASKSSSLAAAATYYWKITTPNTSTRAHFTFSVSSDSSGGLVEFYENPTVNAAGTALTVFNNSRNSATAATVTATYNATSTADGTLVWVQNIGGGVASKIGGDITSRTEYILLQAEDYFIKFTATANGTTACLVATWYENTTWG